MLSAGFAGRESCAAMWPPGFLFSSLRRGYVESHECVGIIAKGQHTPTLTSVISTGSIIEVIIAIRVLYVAHVPRAIRVPE